MRQRQKERTEALRCSRCHMQAMVAWCWLWGSACLAAPMHGMLLWHVVPVHVALDRVLHEPARAAVLELQRVRCRRTEEENSARWEPLGFDRRHNRYWHFRGERVGEGPHNSSCLLMEDAQHRRWQASHAPHHSQHCVLTAGWHACPDCQKPGTRSLVWVMTLGGGGSLRAALAERAGVLQVVQGPEDVAQLVGCLDGRGAREGVLLPALRHAQPDLACAQPAQPVLCVLSLVGAMAPRGSLASGTEGLGQQSAGAATEWQHPGSSPPQLADGRVSRRLPMLDQAGPLAADLLAWLRLPALQAEPGNAAQPLAEALDAFVLLKVPAYACLNLMHGSMHVTSRLASLRQQELA